MTAMTMRERLLAILQGREVDRVPFIQYDGLAAPTAEIWSVLGRNNLGIVRWCGTHRAETPHCKTTSEEFTRDGLKGVRNTLHTPAGDLVEEKLIEPTYGTGSTKKHYIKDPGDYAILAAYLRDMVISDNSEGLLKVMAEIGDDGLPHAAVPRTPYQQLWIQWVNLEDLTYHLADCPERVEECVELMNGHFQRIFEIVAKSPVPYICFPDNITAPAIGVSNFEKYCVPLYRHMADMLAESGRLIFVHMDGNLKALWNAIGKSGVSGLDSLSPPPDNDTSAAQAAGMWPWMRIFLNYPSSVHIMPDAVIRETTERILAGAGHTGRMTIQISENVPPGVWRRSFPIIAGAIEDFGRP
ncbi:MAG TPA: uroporphyrinogen decarboxylase family protein [Candidatus Brocadiia bacterium]|nr:uroporphyrinogen decarboxylase family protein [Candidatus Brocadiia bacterium]